MDEMANLREVIGSCIVNSDTKEITLHSYKDFNSALPYATVLLAS
jgi:hypothetical protein